MKTIPNTESAPAHHAGFVTLVGRPNVGKSTLMNALLGQKVAAVSPRAQTTRRKQLGILTLASAQVVFEDTPGLHIPRHKLGNYMNDVAAATLEDADVILWLVDASSAPTAEDVLISERLKALRRSPTTILALNKIDLLAPEALAEREQAFSALYPPGQIFRLSALNRTGCEILLAALIHNLPEGPAFYDEDAITDFYEREIAADLIREAALLHLRDEVPHCTAVRIDQFTERGETGAYITATLFVEKESQKGIVIGRKGDMLKKIGSTARAQIEEMSGRKVYLELRVKVNPDWRDDPESLRMFGYVMPKEEE